MFEARFGIVICKCRLLSLSTLCLLLIISYYAGATDENRELENAERFEENLNTEKLANTLGCEWFEEYKD